MNDKSMIQEVGGLSSEVPLDSSLAERIPDAGALLEELPGLLMSLPGQVLEIANAVPDMLGLPEFDFDRELGD